MIVKITPPPVATSKKFSQLCPYLDKTLVNFSSVQMRFLWFRNSVSISILVQLNIFFPKQFNATGTSDVEELKKTI